MVYIFGIYIYIYVYILGLYGDYIGIMERKWKPLLGFRVDSGLGFRSSGLGFRICVYSIPQQA